MPALHSYTVTETREVNIAAENMAEAAMLATAVFASRHPDDVIGGLTLEEQDIRGFVNSNVTQTDLSVSRDY